MADVNIKLLLWNILIMRVNGWSRCLDEMDMRCTQHPGKCQMKNNSRWISQTQCEPTILLFCCEDGDINEWYTEDACKGNKIDDSILLNEALDICNHIANVTAVPKTITLSPDDPDGTDGGDNQKTMSATIIIIIIISSIVAVSISIASVVIFIRSRRRKRGAQTKSSPETNVNTMSGAVSYSHRLALTARTSIRDPCDEEADYTYIDNIEECLGNEYNHIQTPVKPLPDNTYSHVRTAVPKNSPGATHVADDMYSHLNNEVGCIKLQSHFNDNTNDYDKAIHTISPAHGNMSYNDSVYNHTTDHNKRN